jgi:RHS repeat-associated protein
VVTQHRGDAEPVHWFFDVFSGPKQSALAPELLPLASRPRLSEEPHQGHQLPPAALHPGIGFAISYTATGLRFPMYDFRSGPLRSGYFRDAETGLDYAMNRFHDPGTGRFMTPDPYRRSARASNPGTWNRYAYVSGDPVNRVDPLGTDDNVQCSDGDFSTDCNNGYVSGCILSSSGGCASDPQDSGSSDDGDDGGDAPVVDDGTLVNGTSATVSASTDPLDSDPLDIGVVFSTTVTSTPCEPSTTGIGGGMIVSGSVGGGVGGAYSLGGTASFGKGWFHNRQGNTRGVFASAGGFLTPSGSLGNYPSNNSTTRNGAWGGFAGAGAGIFLTNAGNSATLKGVFQTRQLTLGHLSLEYDRDQNGVFVFSATWSPGLSRGWPVGAMVLPTNTFITTGTPCP